MRKGTPLALRVLAALKQSTHSPRELAGLLSCRADTARDVLRTLVNLGLVEKRVREAPAGHSPAWLYGLAL